LEAFSDIVMGFSLAQMSLSFVIPAHAADVYLHSVAPIAFAVTFTIVASTWYSHHWLFDRLFVPTPVTIVLNFATLASLIWLVYQLQVFVHFAPTHETQAATVSYLATFAVTWLLLGSVYVSCLWLRWNVLPEADRKSALFKTGRILIIGCASAVGTALMWYLQQPIAIVFWIILGTAILYRVGARAGGLRG
jgi:uncharacterized membrane protein